MTRVTAASRLHFGLFHVPHPAATREPGVRSFGGVGLMVDHPDAVVSVRPAASWQVEGPLASRAQVFAQRFVAGLPDADRRPFQVLVERCPPEHAGLGVGTQLGLAVAKGLAVESGFPELTAADLAALVGRGERSAVGVHGFEHGGLIVEAGKLPGEAVAPLVARVALPDAWRVVLFLPTGRDTAPWHGDRERQAFDRERNPAAGRRLAERLSRLALLDLLPAATAGDLPAFGEAVYEYNRLAGEPFAREQGGPYAGPHVEELVAAVRRTGVKGVGQSSWGPTVFAVAADEAEARTLAIAIGSGANTRAVVTRPRPTGAASMDGDPGYDATPP